MISSPLISIITPTFNRLEYLKETLASVQAQTFQNWEMLIVDDGSSDGTEEMVRQRMKNDPRLRFFKRESLKKGACVCRNEGLKKSSGEYVVFLDSDDLLAADCLERRLAAIKKNSDADFCVFYSQVFLKKPGDTGALWNCFNGEDDLDRFTAFDIVWGPLAVLWKRSALKKTGDWDERLPSYQDFEFHVRALGRKLFYVKVPETDSFYRGGTADSIGLASQSSDKKKHLNSRSVFFEAVISGLRRDKSMTSKRLRNLAEFFTECCEQHLLSKQHLKALSFWFWGFGAGLYGFNVFFKGLKLIILAKVKKEVRFKKKLFPVSFIGGAKTFYVYDQQVQEHQRGLVKNG